MWHTHIRFKAQTLLRYRKLYTEKDQINLKIQNMYDFVCIENEI